jgi:glutathione synthase/RimK-type ligase-like ATP-grasp enzyme
VSLLLRTGIPTWRGVAARLDLLRSTGPRHAWHRLQQERALSALVPSRLNLIAREVWSDAARELDATVREIERGRFEIRRGRTVAVVTGQTVPLNSRSAMALAADKRAVFRLLADAGLPIPEQLSFAANDLGAARAFLARGGPCVVKPARGTGGEGVTGETRSAAELRRAAHAASRFARQLLIERQVVGDVFRLLVLDGQVLDVVRRGLPGITGDGRSTVEELIHAEHDRRVRAEGTPGLKPFIVDLDCILSLKRAGVTLRTVLPDGSSLRIKSVTNYNSPEDNETFRGPISRALTTEVVAAAKVLGLRLAGIDVVTPRPAAGLAASGGAIIDVNETPGLHHHAHVADADGRTHVAIPVLRALLDEPAEHSEVIAQ